MQKSTSFFEIMVELAPLNEGPRGPVPTLKKGTLSRVFLYEHDNTSGTKWPPRVAVYGYLHSSKDMEYQYHL